MPRFVGYIERKPFLAIVDTDAREIEDVGDLRSIPQGIDELIPVSGGVAVRCGPDFFVLEPDLSGKPRPPTPEQLAEVAGVPEIAVRPNGVVRSYRGPIGGIPRLRHPEVRHWGDSTGTLSPDGATLATVGHLTPPFEMGESALALADVATGAVRICEPHIRGFTYPPAWSVDGDLIAFGAPQVSARRVLVADAATATVQTLKFRRSAVMPLLDARRCAVDEARR